MADVINSTKDPGMLHTSFGARMIGVSVEEMARLVKAKDVRAKNTRSAAKAGNFTFGGGGGAATTVLSNRARSKGTTKSPDGLMEYAGIRFCILLDGAERCGEKKQTEWGGAKKTYDSSYLFSLFESGSGGIAPIVVCRVARDEAVF